MTTSSRTTDKSRVLHRAFKAAISLLPLLFATALPFHASGQTVDVLIIYTPAVTSHHGNDDGVASHASAMIESANLAFSNSAIDLRLRLVGLEEVAYTEDPSSQEIDLFRLRETQDSYLNEANEIRNTIGADLVCLLRKGAAGGASGIAFLLDSTTGSPNNGFCVVATEFALSYIFAHEIGHNLGASHARGDMFNGQLSWGGLFSYSNGYRFTQLNNGFPFTYRTIMAYPSGAQIPYFSNPSIDFNGSPTGVDQSSPSSADNALTLNTTGQVVASYKEQPVFLTQDFIILSREYGNYQFPVSASGGTSMDFERIEISSPNDWISVSKFFDPSEKDASYKCSYSMSVDPNMDTSARTGKITIKYRWNATHDLGISRTITVYQQASLMRPDRSYVEVGSGTHAFSIFVNSTVDWTVTSDAEWVTANKLLGGLSTSGTVSLTIDAKQSSGTRTATVILSGGGSKRIITIEQRDDPVVLVEWDLEGEPGNQDFSSGSQIYSDVTPHDLERSVNLTAIPMPNSFCSTGWPLWPPSNADHFYNFGFTAEPDVVVKLSRIDIGTNHSGQGMAMMVNSTALPGNTITGGSGVVIIQNQPTVHTFYLEQKEFDYLKGNVQFSIYSFGFSTDDQFGITYSSRCPGIALYGWRDITQTYDQWVEEHGSDSDYFEKNDVSFPGGLSNLGKYYFGIDPVSGHERDPVFDFSRLGNDKFSFKFSRNSHSTAFIEAGLHWSEDLLTWYPAGVLIGNKLITVSEEVVASDLENKIQTIKATATIHGEAQNRLFMRMIVSEIAN